MELNRLVFRLNLPVFKTGSIRQTVGKKKELGFLEIDVGTPHALNQFADSVEDVEESYTRKRAGLARRGPKQETVEEMTTTSKVVPETASGTQSQPIRARAGADVSGLEEGPLRPRAGAEAARFYDHSDYEAF